MNSKSYFQFDKFEILSQTNQISCFSESGWRDGMMDCAPLLENDAALKAKVHSYFREDPQDIQNEIQSGPDPQCLMWIGNQNSEQSGSSPQ